MERARHKKPLCLCHCSVACQLHETKAGRHARDVAARPRRKEARREREQALKARQAESQQKLHDSWAAELKARDELFASCAFNLFLVPHERAAVERA